MSVHQYYHEAFRNDIAKLFAGMDQRDIRYRFGNDWVRECTLLQRIPEQNRASLLMCLYFTVLFDQAMHAHFWQHHQKFERLTDYPKFIVGFGHEAHLNPLALFEVPLKKQLVSEAELRLLVPKAARLFVDEIEVFFREHLSEVSAYEFFRKLLSDANVTNDELASDGAFPASLRNELRNAFCEFLSRKPHITGIGTR